ncbi:MAG: hypothetical protein R2745_16280 [Vicinamibacterales bacterium]
MHGYFRDDKLNAKDFIANRVLPHQSAGRRHRRALIVRDSLHYFSATQREREPNTIISSPAALPASPDVPQQAHAEQRPRARRLAAGPEGSPHVPLVVLGLEEPVHAGGWHDHPSQAADRSRKAFNVSNTWSRVLSDKFCPGALG